METKDFAGSLSFPRVNAVWFGRLIRYKQSTIEPNESLDTCHAMHYLDDVFPALIQKLATHTSPDPHNELKLLQDEIWSFINTVGRLQGTLVNAAMFVCLRLIYDIGNGCTAVAPGKDLDAMIAGIATEMGKPSMITALTSFGGGGRLEVFMRPPAGIRGA